MEKKYILTDDVIDFNGHNLHRIKAVRDFDCVKAGDLGGFIESEKTLDHDGNAWVFGNARVREPSDIALIKGFGSKFRATSFFRCMDGLVRCQCGCFYGTVDEFRSKVRETHGNSKYAKEYLMIADLI